MIRWQIPTQMFQWTQTVIPVSPDFLNAPKTWLEKQAPALGNSVFLLAFADDGVIWGEVRSGKLELCEPISMGESSFPAAIFSSQTLQQAYLFGEQGELRIWKDEAGFHAARIEDTLGGAQEAFDQDQILFGSAIAGQSPNQFFLVEDGRQGLRHAVPVDLDKDHFQPGKLQRPLRLKVRYYLRSDSEGQTYLAASRLVRLFAVKGGK